MIDPTWFAFFNTNALALFDRARCTRAEKETLVPLACSILECCVHARRNGLLALEDYLDKVDPDFAVNLALVVEGADAGLILQTMVTRTLAPNPVGKELLRGLVIMQGIVDVEMAINPKMLRERQRALFGLDGDLLADDA